MECNKMSEGVAWNQGELSEETRKLVLERTEMINHNMAIFNLIDLHNLQRLNCLPRDTRQNTLRL
jgi:hypothetical protein